MNQLLPALVLASATSALAAEPPASPHVRPLAPPPGPKPFTYVEAPDRLPNYLPGERWGTQGAPITQMQAPLSPEESAKRLVLQPGFAAQLWAHEPDITKPVALAWDDRGRLFIGETVDYPNELQKPGEGRDRIKVCEDTDGDGRADKFTVFADKISIPTSLCFANGGLIVIEGGHTLFLKDTEGDGRADERRVLFSGWGMGDTHATASSLRYGLDNWVWGTVGYSGFDGTVAGKAIKFGMGVFRFRPDGSALEFIRSSNNNTWGLGLSEEGLVFGSTANNNASWFMAIPNRFYEAVSGWSAARMETIADSQAFYPVTDKVRQVDWHHKYTAGAGHALYTARAFPAEFWNRIAFVAEPTGHLVGWFRLDPVGADFKAVNLGSFLASDDEWTAPIVAEVGPDGALWVLDWYNYIIQHNPVPQGFQNGKGNAYETPLRDKRHGRIYRVTADAAPAVVGQAPPPVTRLAGAPPADLVAALKSDNQLWRLHAQRLLVERGRKDVVPTLRELVPATKADAAGLHPAAVHALWTLHSLGAADSAAVAALKHPGADVRRTAASVLPRDEAGATTLLEAGLLRDPDPQVRLAALLALAESSDSEAAGAAIVAFLHDSKNAADRWLREAATAAAARHLDGFGRALLTDAAPLPEDALEAVRIVSRHYAARGDEGVTGVIAALPMTAGTTAAAVLEGLAAGWPDERPLALDDDLRRGLREALTALPAAARAGLLVLVQKWRALDAFPQELAVAKRSLTMELADRSRSDAARLAAARALVRLGDDAESAHAILAQVTPQATPEFGGGLIRTLADSRQAGTAAALLAAWDGLSPGQKRASLGVLSRRAEWAAALLDAVAAGRVLRTDLGPETWQQLRA
ncbi:MAG: PVC-type heme-binding CxxCH protein, partial [Limisphaerales bacterium]